MVSLPIFDMAGARVGDLEVDVDAIAPSISRQLLHDAVVMYQANQRAGTQKTKTRHEVAGSTRKLYRQKGTGNARAGSIRSGVRRGGGHMKARMPRDWSYRLPKKAVKAATRMAFASRLRDQEVLVLEGLKLDGIKTSSMAGVFKALGLAGKSVLLATAGVDRNVYLSSRNIPKVTVSPVGDVNALALLTPYKLIFTREALEQAQQRLKAPPRLTEEE